MSDGGASGREAKIKRERDDDHERGYDGEREGDPEDIERDERQGLPTRKSEQCNERQRGGKTQGTQYPRFEIGGQDEGVHHQPSSCCHPWSDTQTQVLALAVFTVAFIFYLRASSMGSLDDDVVYKHKQRQDSVSLPASPLAASPPDASPPDAAPSFVPPALPAPPSTPQPSMPLSQQCYATWQTATIRMEEEKVSKRHDPVWRYFSGLDGGDKEALFIHVGKAGGSTIQLFLRDAKASYNQVHVHPVLLRVLHPHRQVVICVRDPAERLLSAFNYEYERKLWFDEVMKCFQTMEHMMQAAMITQQATADCQAVARNVLTKPGNGGHMSLGYCFYMGGLMDALRSRRVFLVHTESLAVDLQAAGRWLGLQSTPDVRHWTGGSHRNGEHDAQLSNSSRAFLTRYLADEYEIVHQLELMAENGDPNRYGGQEATTLTSGRTVL